MARPSSISNVPSYLPSDQTRTIPSIDPYSLKDQSATASSNAVISNTLPNPFGRGPSTDMTSQDFHNTEPLIARESHENLSDVRHGDDRQVSLLPDLEMGSITSHMILSPLHEREESSSSSESPLADIMSDGPSKVLINRLTSSNHSIQYDPSSGRLRLSGPTIAFHQFSEMG